MLSKSISSRFLYFYNRFRYSKFYDVVVIGSGHDACEAAYAAARTGAKTALITQNKNTIGQILYNPSMGGIGKGRLIRQVDALGGLIGRVSDISAIQFRVLNFYKGQAVQGIRQQIDKNIFKTTMLKQLKQAQNLTIQQMIIQDFEIDEKGKSIKSLILKSGDKISGKAFVLTTGIFLRRIIHIGKKSYPSFSRIGQNSKYQSVSSIGLVRTLNDLKFSFSRSITKTSPKLDGKTIDYSLAEIQQSDNSIQLFSFLHQWQSFKPRNQLVKCYRLQTNIQTHQIIHDNKFQLPIFDNDQKNEFISTFSTAIQNRVIRFPDMNFHQFWLQPQEVNGDVIYPNGLISSFPQQIQLRMIRTIPALKNVSILSFGHAIQYDYIDPKNLNHTLRSKILDNLYLAGQANGVIGYQQAAAQGIIAGINAGRSAQNLSQYKIDRAKSYIGMLIDNLISQGPTQSYIPRSQYRLVLRPSNADIRLTSQAINLGIISQVQKKNFIQKINCISKALQLLHIHRYSMNQWFKRLPYRAIKQRPLDKTAAQIISTYDIQIKDLHWISGIDKRVHKYLESQLKYQNAIGKILKEFQDEQQKQQLVKIKLENHKDKFIPQQYQILIKNQPNTMKDISNLAGISSTTLLYLKYLLNKQRLSNHFKKYYQNKQSETWTQYTNK